jgi:hypothetical protein
VIAMVTGTPWTRVHKEGVQYERGDRVSVKEQGRAQ